MKRLLYIVILSLLFGSGINAQIIDTLCYHNPFGRYLVQGFPGSSYEWEVTGGIIYNCNGADSIEVHWDPQAATHTLHVVEISENGCHGDTISGEVVIKQPITAEIMGPDSVCTNETITLTGPPNAKTYQWSTGHSSQTIQVNILRDTTIRLITQDGCQSDTTITDITALPLPSAQFSVTPHLALAGEKITFIAEESNAINYIWQILNDEFQGIIPELDYWFSDQGVWQVKLTMENKHQCRDSLTKTVQINEMIVNTITPDGDGINDTWQLDHLENFPQCQIWIFDRASGLIFYSKGYEEPWDGTYNGKPVPNGSYYYVIDHGDGSDPLKGVLTVIR